MRRFLFLMAAVMLASTAIAQYTLLEWSAPLTGDPVVKYRIYKGSDSMSLALYDSVMGDPADTAYVDEVIDEDESVFYRVRGLDAEGLVGAATVLNETLVDLTPNTPTQLYDEGDITMTWSALANATEYSVADADSYRIRWFYGAEVWTYDSEPVVAGEVEFTLVAVEEDETYVIQAMAVYDGWPDDWTNTVADTVQVGTSSAAGDTIMYVFSRNPNISVGLGSGSDPDTLFIVDPVDTTHVYTSPSIVHVDWSDEAHAGRMYMSRLNCANYNDAHDYSSENLRVDMRAGDGWPIEDTKLDAFGLLYADVADSISGKTVVRGLLSLNHQNSAAGRPNNDTEIYLVAVSEDVLYEWPASGSGRNGCNITYSDIGNSTAWTTDLEDFTTVGSVGSVSGQILGSSIRANGPGSFYFADMGAAAAAGWSGGNAGLVLIYGLDAADKTWYMNNVGNSAPVLILEVVE